MSIFSNQINNKKKKNLYAMKIESPQSILIPNPPVDPNSRSKNGKLINQQLTKLINQLFPWFWFV